MRNSVVKFSVILAGICFGSASIVGAESLPKLRLEVGPYEIVEDYVTKPIDPEICDWWATCSDLASVNFFHYKSSSIYLQNSTAKYLKGRPTCKKLITWLPKDVTIVNGLITRATGSYTEKCGSSAPTRGVTSELPIDDHLQAFGPAPSKTYLSKWEGELVDGTDRRTFNTKTVIKYDQMPTSLFARQALRIALGGSRASDGKPASIPAGVTCDNFQIGEFNQARKLTNLDINDQANSSFISKMKALFSKPLLCQAQANLWESDEKGFDVTPRPNTAFTKSQVFNYRIELGKLEEK